jgi:hypothetical protein
MPCAIEQPSNGKSSDPEPARQVDARASRQLPKFLEALLAGSAIKPNLPESPAIIRRMFQLPFDAPLVLVVIILIVFGLMMIFSASTDFSMVMLGEAPTFLFNRQLMWLGVGLALQPPDVL